MFRLQKVAENIFVIFTLFLSTAALIPVLLETEEAPGQPTDPFTPILFMGIYAITLLLIVPIRNSFVRVATKDILIWLVVGLALMSILWTFAPEVTQRRSISLLGATVFGVYISARYSIREQLRLLAWVFGIIIVLSCLFAIALPSYGLMTFQEEGIHAGAWRGVMMHKNLLGRIMSLSSVVHAILATGKPLPFGRYQWVAWAGYILSVALVVLSTSKTALIVCITMTIILPLYKSLRGTYNQVIPLLIAVILVVGSTATLLLDNLTFIAGALGKDLTLTGRTDIWALMLDMISQRPLFGYGFNAFWLGWDSEASAYVWRMLQWECPYAHNGFMDLLAELGIAGLALFLLSFVTAFVKAISWLRATKGVEGLFPLLFLSYLFLYNITESTLLSGNSIFWILYVSVIFSMAIEYNLVKKFGDQSAVLEEEWFDVQASNEQNF